MPQSPNEPAATISPRKAPTSFSFIGSFLHTPCLISAPKFPPTNPLVSTQIFSHAPTFLSSYRPLNSPASFHPPKLPLKNESITHTMVTAIKQHLGPSLRKIMPPLTRNIKAAKNPRAPIRLLSHFSRQTSSPFSSMLYVPLQAPYLRAPENTKTGSFPPLLFSFL